MSERNVAIRSFVGAIIPNSLPCKLCPSGPEWARVGPSGSSSQTAGHQSGTFPRTVRYTQDQTEVEANDQESGRRTCRLPRADKGEFRGLGRYCRTDHARKAKVHPQLCEADCLLFTQAIEFASSEQKVAEPLSGS
jgi:hypothetical protein